MYINDAKKYDCLKPILDKLLIKHKGDKTKITPMEMIEALSEELVVKNDFIDSVIGTLEKGYKQQQTIMSDIRYKHKKIL